MGWVGFGGFWLGFWLCFGGFGWVFGCVLVDLAGFFGSDAVLTQHRNLEIIHSAQQILVLAIVSLCQNPSRGRLVAPRRETTPRARSRGSRTVQSES